MSRFQGTVNAANLRIDDEEKGALWLPALGYGYHNRGPQALAFFWDERAMWPRAGFMAGDRSVPTSVLGMDAGDRDDFGPWSLGISGHNSPYFLTGYCRDADGAPIGGATVQAFVTATDQFVAETACDDRGFYQVPCQAEVPHYLVAYYPGAPAKAGTSVNTLVPARG